MEFDGHDIAVIEQALREAINQGIDYQAITNYRGVLRKLQTLPVDQGFQLNAGEGVPLDGFRYDYDDSAGT